MKYRNLKMAAALTAVLASPLAFSEEASKLTGYFGADLGGGYSSGINLGDDSNNLGQGLFSDYNWNIYFGFSGSNPLKAIKPDLDLIFGADFSASNPVGKIAFDSFKEDAFGLSTKIKSLYIGLAFPTYGKLKVGNLSTNSLGLTPDFWSTGGVANLTLYKRTFFPVTNAILYESPDFGGVSFHLVKGFAKRITGIYDRFDPEGSPINPITEPTNTYGGTVQYQKNGHFIKYTGLIREDGLLERKPDSTEKVKHNAFLHRIESGLYEGNLFMALGYQYLYNNAGWGHTLAFMSDEEIRRFTARDPEPEYDKDGNIIGNPNEPYGTGIKYFAFPMHEVALSASYTLGKLTPKASIAFGKGAENSYAIDEISKYDLPGYIQYVVGADYALSNNVFLNVGYGNLAWQHKEGTPDDRKWFDQKSFLVNLSYWF